jgi:hypothetical protein
MKPVFRPFWKVPDHPELIGVCAWCCPGGSEAFLASYLMFRGLKVTHGICPAHSQEMDCELDSMEQIIAKPISH